MRYIRSLRSNFWEFCREYCCAEGVYNQLEKEQQGVEAQGCKYVEIDALCFVYTCRRLIDLCRCLSDCRYNALSAWQMAINSTPIVADQPDDVRVYVLDLSLLPCIHAGD